MSSSRLHRLKLKGTNAEDSSRRPQIITMLSVTFPSCAIRMSVYRINLSKEKHLSPDDLQISTSTRTTMSPLAGMKDLLMSVAKSQSGDYHHGAGVNDVIELRSIHASASLSAGLSHRKPSNESRTDSIRSICSTGETSATSDDGDMDRGVSRTPTGSDTDSTPSNSSSQLSRAYSSASTTSNATVETVEYNPLHRCQARQVGEASTSPMRTARGLNDEFAPASESSSPASSTAEPFVYRDWPVSEKRANPVGYHEYNLAETREYFRLNDANTRYQRRTFLYNLVRRYNSKAIDCAVWMAAHPSDLWDTKAEERAAFTPTQGDALVDNAEWEDKHGHKDMSFECPEYQAAMDERAKAVGHYQAWQETIFEEEWVTGDGCFGKKSSGGPPPPDVGPMGETI